MVPKWDAEHCVSISLLCQTSLVSVRKCAMHTASWVSQINLSSTSENATRAYAHQTFGQLCITGKSPAVLSDVSATQKPEGVIKRGEKGLWDSLIFRISLVLQPFLVISFAFWQTLSKNVKNPSSHMRSHLPRRSFSRVNTHLPCSVCTRYHFPDPAVLPTYIITPCHFRW